MIIIILRTYLGGVIDENASIDPEIERRIRCAWACFKKYGRELYHRPTAPPKLKVRMLKAEVLETLLYGCMTWTLGREHYAKLRTVHHQLLLRTIGFSRRQRSDHVLSYSKALKKTQCESVETTVRKRRLLFAGAVAIKHDGRLPRRVMFGALSGGGNPGPGRPEKNWLQCVSDDLQAFRATDGSTEDSPSIFGIETVLWPTAAKQWGKWYNGVVVGAERLMVEWHQHEAKKCARLAKEVAQ